MKVFSHRVSVGNSAETKDLVVPAGKTIMIQAMDFSGPSFTAPGMRIIRDPGGDAEDLGLAAGDKYMLLPSGIQILGPETVRIHLEKVGPGGASVLMGAAFYYEEL